MEMASTNGTAESESQSQSPAAAVAEAPRRTSSLTSPDLPGGSSSSRSCITCRRRKVRCNKQQPCSNCISHRTICEYPSSNRPKRRRRADNAREDALLQQLRRLEGMVERISKTGTPSSTDEREEKSPDLAEVQTANTVGKGNEDDTLSKGFGKLVVDEGGKSRYVANTLWTSLNDELNSIRGLMDESSEDDEPAMADDAPKEFSHGAFMLSYRSVAVNMRPFYPDVEKALKLWDIYKENVQPLCIILHIPTFEKTVLQSIHDPTYTSKEMEAMMFTIYYAAIMTLTDEQCREIMSEEKTALLDRFQFTVEQSLARANFLTSKSMLVLQAFTQFLVSARFRLTPHYAWSLMGMVARVAFALGVHRDGSLFGLDPFETEIRRRLWWQIVVLDVRINEDFGSDATMMRESYDAKIFLNINDADIWPGMTEPPKERQGMTDSSFSQLRAMLSDMYRRLLPNTQISGSGVHSARDFPLAERCSWIEELTKKVENDYLKYYDLTIPFHWGTATVARLVLAKLWLIVYQPLQKGGEPCSPATKDRLFEIGVDVVEYSRMMMSERSMRKWGWMSRTYVQWHVVAFVLQELRTRTKGPDVERAWTSINGIWKEWDEVYPDQKTGIWKPLRWILSKAKAARQAELDKERAVAQLSNLQSLPNLPPMEMDFGTMSTMTTPPTFTSSNSNESQDIYDMFTLEEHSIYNPPEINEFNVPAWEDSGAAFPAMYAPQPNAFSPGTGSYPTGNLW